MFDKLQQVEARYDELEALLCDPAIVGDREQFQKLSKERSEIHELVETYRDYRGTRQRIEDNKELINDPELRELAKEELDADRPRLANLEQQLRILLVPKDPNDDKNIMLEIRAGTGGEEASLFAADLLRMYTRFAERNGWENRAVERQ